MSALPRLLLIGPLPIPADVIGGTKVSFASMVAELRATGRYELCVHNTSRPLAGRGRLGRLAQDLWALLGVVLRLLSPRSRFDAVVFNTSSGGALRSGWLLWACCRLRRLPFVVRVFGGDLDLFHQRAGALTRGLARRTLLDADLLLLQTHALCEEFADAARVRWWPTTREFEAPRRDPAQRATRFLFLGQLRREKGVAEAIEAAGQLPEGVQLSLYGPKMAGFDIRAALEGQGCSYGGSLAMDQVPAVLARHDVLVFPSYHGGEGLPGILIEALQSGLPVIATRWRALPEIIEDGANGLLIEPRDSASLAAAMGRLAEDEALYAQLRSGALQSGERFRASRWAATLCDWLDELRGVPASAPFESAASTTGEAA